MTLFSREFLSLCSYVIFHAVISLTSVSPTRLWAGALSGSAHHWISRGQRRVAQQILVVGREVERRGGRGRVEGEGTRGSHTAESPKFSHERSGLTALQSSKLELSTAFILPGALIVSKMQTASHHQPKSEHPLYSEKSANLLASHSPFFTSHFSSILHCASSHFEEPNCHHVL